MILNSSFNKAPWRRDGKEKNLREKFVGLLPESELKKLKNEPNMWRNSCLFDGDTTFWCPFNLSGGDRDHERRKESGSF